MTYMPGYPCEMCKRASNGFSITVPGKPVMQFCSHNCARDYMRNPNLTPNEAKAVLVGGNDGGAYLESIGQFDLRNLTAAQWAEFCGKIFRGTCAELQRVADDEIPF